MEEEHFIKLVLISGASHALAFKRNNPRASDDEAIKHVTSESDEILKKIDRDG
jgi:hypothetical protein